MRVLLYARRGMLEWLQYIAAHLTFASQVVIASELKCDGVMSAADHFYKYYNTIDISRQALDKFGDEVCDEIIARCRLLRSLPKAQSIKMIGAVWRSWQELIDVVKPDVFIGLRVDSYVLDIIERTLKERDIPYIGLWKAPLIPNRVFFTARGEHISLREPSDEEISSAIERVGQSDFQATSLKRQARYGFFEFAKRHAYESLRDIFLDIQRWVVKDPLGYRYLATSKHVHEYRVTLGDWNIMRFIDDKWDEALESVPFEKRVFVGLQLNPEATIDYYVKNLEFVDYQSMLIRIITSLGNGGYEVFLKDHPNAFGKRHLEFYKQLRRLNNITFIPYHISSNELIERCRATFTWTGTIGFQAALAGRCSIVVDPPYFIPGPFLRINDVADIESLPTLVRNFAPPPHLDDTRKALMRHVLSTYIPGSMKWKKFEKTHKTSMVETEDLLQSLNQYIPDYLHS